MLRHQFTNRHAAQVHEGLWFRQQDLLVADFCPRRERMTLAISYFHAAVVRDAVNGEKAQIVRRELVFNARIAQPDNQFHARSFLPTIACVGTAAPGCPAEQRSANSQPEPKPKKPV